MPQEQKPKSVSEIDSSNSKETWRIVKNVVIISLAFMVQFTAYSEQCFNDYVIYLFCSMIRLFRVIALFLSGKVVSAMGAANLQSSINAEAGLGTASLAAVYAGLIFSNIFLPVVVIKWLGTKWAISLSFLTYMPYIAAQFKPSFYTMIPAGLIVGLGGGPLWCAKCTYLSVVSEAHNKISKIPVDALLTRFLGLFFMIFQTNQVWGNLISSLVLSSGDNAAAVTSLNVSQIPELCGANFLPAADAGEALPPQPPAKIQMIAGIYLACMAAASVIVAVGVNSTKRYELERKSESTSGLALLAVTLKLLLEPNQLLLVIINIYIGFQQAFFGADFTAAFVSCAVGTGTVGFVMMTYGVADAIGCVVTGYLAKVTGRLALICVATVVHTCLFITILAWRPQAGFSYVLFIIAVLWGLADSIWIVQINAYSGILFPGREEAAFSNFRLWESVGYIIAYVISPYLRTSAKTYFMITMMVVGVAGYFAVEVRDRRTRQTLEITKEVPMKLKGCDNVGFQKEI